MEKFNGVAYINGFYIIRFIALSIFVYLQFLVSKRTKKMRFLQIVLTSFLIGVSVKHFLSILLNSTPRAPLYIYIPSWIIAIVYCVTLYQTLRNIYSFIRIVKEKI